MFGKTLGKFNFFRKHLISKSVLKIKNVLWKNPFIASSHDEFCLSLYVSFTQIEKSNQVTYARQKPNIKLSSGSRRLCEIEQNIDVKSKIFHGYFYQYTITAVLLGTFFL